MVNAHNLKRPGFDLSKLYAIMQAQSALNERPTYTPLSSVFDPAPSAGPVPPFVQEERPDAAPASPVTPPVVAMMRSLRGRPPGPLVTNPDGSLLVTSPPGDQADMLAIVQGMATPEARSRGYRALANSRFKDRMSPKKPTVLEQKFDLGTELRKTLSLEAIDTQLGTKTDVPPEVSLAKFGEAWDGGLVAGVDANDLRAQADSLLGQMQDVLKQRADTAFEMPERKKLDQRVGTMVVLMMMLSAAFGNEDAIGQTAALFQNMDARLDQEFQDAIAQEKARVGMKIDSLGAQADSLTLAYNDVLNKITERGVQSRFEAEQERLRTRDEEENFTDLIDQFAKTNSESTVDSLARRINAIRPGSLTPDDIAARKAEARSEFESIQKGRDALSYQREGSGALSLAKAEDLISTQPERLNKLIAETGLIGARAELARENAKYVGVSWYVDYAKAMADIEQGWKQLEIAEKRADSAGAKSARSRVDAGVGKLNDILKAERTSKQREIDSLRTDMRSKYIDTGTKALIPGMIEILEGEIEDINGQMKANLRQMGVKGEGG